MRIAAGNTNRTEQARERAVPRLDRSNARSAVAHGLEHEAVLGPEQPANAASPRELGRSHRACSRGSSIGEGRPGDLHLDAIAEPERRRRAAAEHRHERARHPRRPRRDVDQLVEHALRWSLDGALGLGNEGHDRATVARTCVDVHAIAATAAQGKPGPVFAFAPTCARVGPSRERFATAHVRDAVHTASPFSETGGSSEQVLFFTVQLAICEPAALNRESESWVSCFHAFRAGTRAVRCAVARVTRCNEGLVLA